MKKIILVLSIAFVGIISLLFLYQKSQSVVLNQQQEFLYLLLRAEQINSEVKENLLKSKNFILMSYDPIVKNVSQMQDVCEKLRGRFYFSKIENTIGLEKNFDDFCTNVEVMSSAVEEFKSKNAIFKNSLSFLVEASKGSVKTEQEKKLGRYKEIVSLGLLYAHQPTKDIENHFVEQISKIEKDRERKESLFHSFLLAHAKKVLESKKSLTALLQNLLSNNIKNVVREIRKDYYKVLTVSEKDSLFYKRGLLGAGIFFFMFFIIGFVQLWRAKEDLTEANEKLESRVAARTKQLEQSKEKIFLQQQDLLSSARLSALGEMSGQIAHEMNTPLGAISLTAGSLKKKVLAQQIDPKAFEQKIDLILSVSKRLAKIIDSVRKMSKADEGEELLPVHIQSLVEDTLLLCEGRFKKSGVEVMVSYNADLSEEVFCRPTEIGQVLVNLLNNALDATNETEKEDKWVKVCIDGDKANYVVSVSDNGAGVPISLREKIFQPKFSTKSLANGTGLGLSLSSQIISSHGGALQLDLTSSETSFVFNLPKKNLAA